MKNIGLKTVLSTLVFFGITYMLLVFTNRAGNIPYLFAGFTLLFVGIILFLQSIKSVQSSRLKHSDSGNTVPVLYEKEKFYSNLLAIISGISLWGFFGEFLENADIYIKDATIEIAHGNFLPVLILIIFIFLNLKKHLPVPIKFSISSFLLIWSMHYIMIFQYEVLSRTHFTTYIMCCVFLILTGLSIYKAKKNKGINSIMFWSYFGLLCVWSILEYVWGWRLIPGPYAM
ncbi:MAG: hypothetical protein APR54_11700 [Candidatus Cloacimonas sp. SDB]|nr:MAG: hypothetical protein APR54_11700 [Candidatus Cloacimonas sp. SDB]